MFTYILINVKLYITSVSCSINLIGFPGTVSEGAGLRDTAENAGVELFVVVLHLPQDIVHEVVYLIFIFLIHDWKCVGSNETYGTESLHM